MSVENLTRPPSVPTRATKVEPADPPIPEPEQPPPVEHSSNMDYGESISAGMRALRVLDGDITNRRDGCGSERVHEPDNESKESLVFAH